jgi:hypothetical protein
MRELAKRTGFNENYVSLDVAVLSSEMTVAIFGGDSDPSLRVARVPCRSSLAAFEDRVQTTREPRSAGSSPKKAAEAMPRIEVKQSTCRFRETELPGGCSTRVRNLKPLEPSEHK